jgi:hypothetical protein
MPRAIFVALTLLLVASAPAVASASPWCGTACERLADAQVILWNDVYHRSPQPLATLRDALPHLHELGYRQLYIEESDYAAEEIAAALAARPATLDDITWADDERQAIWLDIIHFLASKQGCEAWTVVPIDFKKRDDFKQRMRRVFAETPEDLQLCGVPWPQIPAAEREGFTGIFIDRALDDTLSFELFQDTWNPERKTVIFYGAAHGLLTDLPVTYQGRRLAYMAHHLKQRFGERFLSVMTAPRGDWPAQVLALPLGTAGFIEGAAIDDDAAERMIRFLLGIAWYPDDACREAMLNPPFSFTRYYDLLWVEPDAASLRAR